MKYICLGNGHNLRVVPVDDVMSEAHPTPLLALRARYDSVVLQENTMRDRVADIREAQEKMAAELKKVQMARQALTIERGRLAAYIHEEELRVTAEKSIADKVFGFRTEPDGTRVRVMKSGKEYTK